MADWIYCGTNPPVNAAGTQSLLRSHNAIWCSPPGLRPWPGSPQPGDRIWLLWADSTGAPLLLGGGLLVGNSQTRFGTVMLHTNSDIAGVREEAEELGYGGGLGMSFLRVENVGFPANDRPPVPGLGLVPTALSQATVDQCEVLAAVLPI